MESLEDSANARTNSIEDATSPKLLPRVSISNIKSPSKRHSLGKQSLDNTMNGSFLDWLPEVKQFVSFFNIHFYYQKTISDEENLLKQKYTRLHQTLISLEPAKPTPSKGSKRVNQQTNQQTLELLQQVQSLTVELFGLIRETIQKNSLPSNILKGILRTVSKMFEYKKTLVVLLQRAAGVKDNSDKADSSAFKPGLFLKTLFECQFDTHDAYQEEIILLTIQKLVIQVTKHFSDQMSTDEIFKNCVYFFRVLKKRAINDHQITSLHMQEGTKQNMNKLFAIIMKKEDNQMHLQQQHMTFQKAAAAPEQNSEDQSEYKYRTLKRKVFHLFKRKVLKNLMKIEELIASQSGSIAEIAIKREYVCFIIKAFMESFQALTRVPGGQDELKLFIIQEKEILFQVLCRAGEFDSIVIRNMAQLLFSSLMQQVLDLHVPFREELEVLYVKLLLKPLEQLDKRFQDRQIAAQGLTAPNPGDRDKISMQTDASAAMGEVSFLSDDEDNNESKVPSTAATSAASLVYDQSDNFELEVCLNLLIETLLALQPDQLAQMFLVYDCQPLSENLIRRSLHLLLKHSQQQGQSTDLSKTYQVIGLIMQSLQRYELSIADSKQQQANFVDSQSLKGMQSILDMLALKKKAKLCGEKANMKPKAFFTAIEQGFEGLTMEQTSKLASKVLLNSRRVSLDKIAEIIGGKDDRAKLVLEEYLERQDYAECNIEQSMRGFLQTFRMAGVDSQVVFNILEKFGDKYFEKDHKKQFTTGAEAYNFAYLIIVLQTCQHNAAIKEKTSLERFYGQAKEMVPESYDQLPEGMVEKLFHKITSHEIKAPVTRDLINGNYELACGQQEISQRTVTAPQGEIAEIWMSESEFLSTADLREKQLFDLHNHILNVAPESLQVAALRQIVNILTAKSCQIRQRVGDSRFNQARTLEITKTLIQTNGHFRNNEWVDRLMLDMDRQVDMFCRISKLEDSRKNQAKDDLQNLFWSNFKSIKQATGLITKMAPSMSRCNIHYASYNAVEVKIRNKFSKNIPVAGLVTRMADDKVIAESENEAQSQIPVTITPVQQKSPAQVLSPDPKGGVVNPHPNLQTTPKQNSGLFNMVYNYFTPVPSEAEEEAKKRDYIMSGQNQIDLLKHQLEEFNRNTRSGNGNGILANSGPENVNDSYFFDFLVSKGIDTGEALRQIATFIRENMSSRKASLCLSYLFRVYLDSQSSQDIEMSMQVQHTILQLVQSLVHQITNRNQSGNSPGFGGHQRSSSYGNFSLNTQEDQLSDSQEDSISQKSDSTLELKGGSHRNLAKIFLRDPKRNQFETEIATWVNKHLALELYFSVVGAFIVQEMTTGGLELQQTDTRPTTNQLIKDVQKTLMSLSEDELTRDDFEQAFLFEKVAEFIRPSKMTADDLNRTGGLDDDDEGTQKPNESEESKRPASQRPVSPSNFGSILPLREYPKMGKFLHLIFILVAQTTSTTKTVSNEDHVQVALTKLMLSISQMFSMQETVPYDQINRSLDVLIKNSGPFENFHELAGDYLEDLLAVCQEFFQLLERGSDGSEQKLFQQGQFDLWFRTMSVLIQKVLLSPYIELFKSVQERTCTIVKIQILTFQFQPLTSNAGDSPAASQARNYTKMIFEELLFTLNIAALQTQREWLNQRVEESQKVSNWASLYKARWEDAHEGFAQLCQLCANTLTDVFIQYAQQMAQEKVITAETYEVFGILWNKFMLVLLNYADSTESLLIEDTEVFASVQPLQHSIQDNIQRVMEFLLSQNLLLESSPKANEDPVVESKVKLYAKTKAALGLFWQEVQIRQTPGGEP